MSWWKPEQSGEAEERWGRGGAGKVAFCCRGEQEEVKGEEGGQRWSESPVIALTLCCSRGVTQSKPVMNSVPSAPRWEQSHRSQGFFFMTTSSETWRGDGTPERIRAAEVPRQPAVTVKWRRWTGGDT